MFRLITLNLNGIRSAADKGFVQWAEQAGADCIGVQEVKAQADTVQGRFDKLGDLHGHFHHAQKKGYAGVGLYARKAPSDVKIGFGCKEFDAEGRWIETRFDTAKKKFSVISCYFPSGSSGPERQEAKFRFLARMYPHLVKLKTQREFVLMGDVNIAHHEIDLKNWKGNQKNSGFLPEERAWLTKLFDRAGLVDVFRTLNNKPEQYTWWSQRSAGARENNVGWRLDYHIATPAIAATVKREEIYLAQRFSDHAPVVMDYQWKL